MSWADAMNSQAVALSMVRSKSLARRRLRLSHAKVRSTTQRRGKSLKPLAASERLMISSVHLPIADVRPARVEPGTHGQAAIPLAEGILHALVEGKILTIDEAVAVIRTAPEVKIEVALEAHESRGRTIESLNLLSAMSKSFEADR